MKKLILVILLTCFLLVNSSLEANQKKRKPKAARIPPTHSNINYGPHKRNVMDVWLANTANPSPVLVSIHGGGFRNGDKSVPPNLLKACLKNGISVVTISYRYSNQAIAPAQFLDAARAVQFIRHHSGNWNLDPTRIAATGISAGGGLSLWLAFHQDLADPDNPDPVLRQSTRLKCVAVHNSQVSYDPSIDIKIFPSSVNWKRDNLAQLIGVNPTQLSQLSREKLRLLEEISPVYHLSPNAPPALLMYRAKLKAPAGKQKIAVHHPRNGQYLKQKMDQAGLKCRLVTQVKYGSPKHAGMTVLFLKNNL